MSTSKKLATETRSPRAKVVLVESVPLGICQAHLHFTGMETGPGSINSHAMEYKGASSFQEKSGKTGTDDGDARCLGIHSRLWAGSPGLLGQIIRLLYHFPTARAVSRAGEEVLRLDCVKFNVINFWS